MSLILKTTVRLRGKTLARQLDAAAETPAAAQQAFLRRILNQNAATAFGREHQFSHLQREQDYRNAVPIADYEAFRPYINRLLEKRLSSLLHRPLCLPSPAAPPASLNTFLSPVSLKN